MGDECRVFVGRVPRASTEEEFQRIFASSPGLVEAVLLRDKETGASKGSGILKFSSPAGAAEACQKYNGSLTLAQELGPIQVRIADRDALRLQIPQDLIDCRGPAKLFVGGLPRSNWTEEETKNLFERHGTVIEVYHIKTKEGNFSGASMVKFPQVAEALAAIQALDRQQVQGSPRPLEVRFAQKRQPPALGAPQQQMGAGFGAYPLGGGYPQPHMQPRPGTYGAGAGVPPPPPGPRVIGNWTEHFDATGKPYYYNTISRRSQWEMPPEFWPPGGHHAGFQQNRGPKAW
eukprot:CAMPEP_0204366030 /NCGR_PEP_ID=MMETSP0469-20131031/42356_1 /ASSEMBLY_ACC=CAM_ASM_000384 /TAXON_ID=2969 /ORGANISM="Oxyrrhis marina" /LENGTH=288 /DNA_ID=CAMNT_0051355175 /DNA_START=57 /DNA_END=920 /DNA_ORIENTATION=-